MATKLKSGDRVSFYNDSRAVMLAENTRVANDFVGRMRGLLGTTSLPAGEGLLIDPCSAIHMIGMQYAIDALFMDKHYKVVGLVHSIEPGQLSRNFLSARSCLELPAGVLKETGTEEGDQVVIRPRST